MSCVEKIKGCVTQGNDWFLNITVTSTGAVDTDSGEPTDPKDLTGATIDFDFKEKKIGQVIITPTQDLTDLATGRIGFSLSAAQTQTLVNPSGHTATLTGAPRVNYADGTVDDLFEYELEIEGSWN